MFRLATLAVVCLGVIGGAVTADWPAWRGPDGDSVAPPGAYPVEFGPDQNELWSVDLPGVGASTPVVWDGAIYLTAVEDGKNLVCSYNLDGDQRWRQPLGDADQAKHRSATGANPSMVADAQHVVAYFKSGELACLTHDGQTQWSVNLQDKFGGNTLWWDLGSSPVLTSHGVCVAVMQEGDSYLVTFDLDSGEVVWKQARQYQRPRESDQAYTTPSVVDHDGTETIVTWGADYLTGHDAKTGKLLWEQGGFNPGNQGMWRVIASATVVDDVAYVPFGRGDHLAAVRIGASGDIAGADHLLWNRDQSGADVPTPVVHEGKIYVLRDEREVVCLDASTGDEHWKEPLPRSRRKYFSSPLLADGKLYCVREDGAVVVLEVSDTAGNVVAVNNLGEDTVASPTPVDGTLLLRTRSKLFRFGA